MMLNDLLIFLSKHKSCSDKPGTLTGMYTPFRGSWHVVDKDMDTFWELYTNLYETKRKNNTRLGMGITEVQGTHCCLLIDVDLKFSKTDITKGRMYTKDDICRIVHIYRDIIKNVVTDQTIEDPYVFEKQEPRIKEDIIKDGFHIMFLDVVVTKEMHKYIHNKAISVISGMSDFDHLVGVQELSDIVDAAIVNNNWMIYGTHKREENFGYQATGRVSTDFFYEVTCDDPRFFSIQNRTPSKIREDFTPEHPSPPSRQTDELVIDDTFCIDTCDKARSLLWMLSDKRVEDEPLWVRVGWCLRNINTTLLPLWDEWSQRSSKYSPGECEKRWKRFKPMGYKMNSLCYWAKNDNPEAYEAWLQANTKMAIRYSINCGAHYDIAMILYCKYEDKYKSLNPKRSDDWYYFDNHRWHEMPGGYLLMNEMSTELSREFMKMSNEYKKLMIHTDQNVVNENKNKMNKCLKLAYQVKDNGFKSGVLKECTRLFYDPDFEKNLDDNANLVGFNNGVYDIEAKEFRPGQPDDYVSKTTGIDYIEFDESNETVQEIYRFFIQVLPDKEIREYVLTIFATFLGGSTEEQTFQIWTGGGSNGKSTVVELFERAFGHEYTGKFSTTLLTRDRANSNACTPELQDVMRKRFASMQEPNDNDVIYTGAMKEYTGGDKIYSRGLYSKPTPFKPQFKLVMLCNKMPQIKGWDYGTWRRIRVVPFTSSFVDRPNPQNENEYAKDRKLTQKFDLWKEAFMWILIQRSKNYMKHGIREPRLVIQASSEYKKKSDAFMTFLEENFEQSAQEADKITSQQIYETCKLWWRNTMNTNSPTKTDLLDYIQFNTKYKKSGKNAYLLRFKNMEEI